MSFNRIEEGHPVCGGIFSLCEARFRSTKAGRKRITKASEYRNH
jgi:hypothetical protein